MGCIVKAECRQDALRSRKVVRAILGDVGGGVDTPQERHIASKADYLVTSRFVRILFQRFCDDLK